MMEFTYENAPNKVMVALDGLCFSGFSTLVIVLPLRICRKLDRI